MTDLCGGTDDYGGHCYDEHGDDGGDGDDGDDGAKPYGVMMSTETMTIHLCVITRITV